MRKQNFIRAIEIHKELGDFNGCEIGVRYSDRRFNRPKIIYRKINRRK